MMLYFIEQITRLEVQNALFGGLLIGFSALFLAWTLGRIMGISGILKWILEKEEWVLWRWFFIIGILLGVSIYMLVNPDYQIMSAPRPLALMAVSWLLIGVGVTLANGCTSGHAVCGIGRMSVRSVVATVLFLGTAIATNWVVTQF